MKKVPLRTCMGCNSKKTKKELIRIVKNKENNVSIDKTGKMEGRGAYICDDIACLEKVIKSKKKKKVLDIAISEQTYNELRSVIVDQ